MNACPRCDRQLSTDAFVCGQCAISARKDLIEVAWFIRRIDSKRARRGSRLFIGGGSSPAETPLPYDTRVGRTFGPIQNGLVGWARIHNDQHFDHPQIPRGLAGVAEWLADHAEWASRQQWAFEAFECYASSREALKDLFDSPPDREAIGTCNAVDEHEYPCAEILSAVKGEEQHTCPKCGTVHNVKERRDSLLAQASDLTVTVAEAVKLLRTSDRDVHPRLVRAAIRFVPINTSGDRLELDKHGKVHRVSIFRLGAIRDALALYDEGGDTRKGINRAMRGQRDSEAATLSVRGIGV